MVSLTQNQSECSHWLQDLFRLWFNHPTQNLGIKGLVKISSSNLDSMRSSADWNFMNHCIFRHLANYANLKGGPKYKDRKWMKGGGARKHIDNRPFPCQRSLSTEGNINQHCGDHWMLKPHPVCCNQPLHDFWWVKKRGCHIWPFGCKELKNMSPMTIAKTMWKFIDSLS